MDTNKMRDLKVLAEALPKQFWEAAHPNVGGRGWEVKAGIDQVAADLTEARAAFIAAADPVTVLALLDEIDQIKDENETLRSAALAAGEFIMHEAEVRGLLDDKGQVSHRHPRRQQAIARIEEALAKEASHD
ncbi:hypothetical protein D3C80_1641690 [compost metagenome]